MRIRRKDRDLPEAPRPGESADLPYDYDREGSVPPEPVTSLITPEPGHAAAEVPGPSEPESTPPPAESVVSTSPRGRTDPAGPCGDSGPRPRRHSPTGGRCRAGSRGRTRPGRRSGPDRSGSHSAGPDPRRGARGTGGDGPGRGARAGGPGSGSQEAARRAGTFHQGRRHGAAQRIEAGATGAAPGHRRRQPEGGRGQDHHHGQPRCRPGRAGLPGPGGRPRPPGQRHDRAGGRCPELRAVHVRRDHAGPAPRGLHRADQRQEPLRRAGHHRPGRRRDRARPRLQP